MKPIDFAGANANFNAPKNWDATRNGPCRVLPTKVDENGRIMSVWEPSQRERRQIAHGDNVLLTCFVIQPPVTLSIAATDDKTHIGLPAAEYKKFIDDLDAPSAPNEALRALFRPDPWFDHWDQPRRALLARIGATMRNNHVALSASAFLIVLFLYALLSA